MRDRKRGRADRLIQAGNDITDQLQADPSGPRSEALRKRLMEIVASIENLKQYGMERPFPSQEGVTIEAPLGRFKSAAEGK